MYHIYADAMYNLADYRSELLAGDAFCIVLGPDKEMMSKAFGLASKVGP
jgi:hypothetical protein